MDLGATLRQNFDRAAGEVAFQLHDASVERDVAVHRSEQPESPFASDIGGFDGGAVFQNGQQRKHLSLREIDMFQVATGIADYIAELEAHGLEVGNDPSLNLGLKCADELVSTQTW